MSPRGIQPDIGFFSEEEKQESIQIEGSAPEGSIISNQAAEGEISTIVAVKLESAKSKRVFYTKNSLSRVVILSFYKL